MRRRSYLYIFAIILLGFGLSVHSFLRITVHETEKSEARLSAQAHNIANEFQKYLLSKYNTLRYMKAYFYAYEAIGLEEFELFSTSILLFEPDIDSLLFVLQMNPEAYSEYSRYYQSVYKQNLPELAQAQKQDGSKDLYLAHYMKSFAQNPRKTGSNLADDPNVYKTLQNAFKDTAPKMAFLSSADEAARRDVYIIDPLFTVNKQTQKVENRINIANYFADYGYIFMGLDLNKFVQNQQSLLSEALCLDLSYMQRGALRPVFGSQAACAQQGETTTVFDIDFTLLGINWVLKFVPRETEETAALTWQKYFVLYGGMVFTLLLAAYVYIILWQRAKERTAQRKLNEEIAKKEQLNLQMQDYTDKLELARLQQMDIYRSLQEEKLKAEQANKTKSDFLANMSHELRTPLNSIIGIAKIIKEDVVDKPETTEMIDILEASSQALLEIVNDILDLSKIEAGKVELESIDFDIREVIHNVTASLKPIADRKGLYLNTKFNKEDFPLLKGDPLRISRVMMNLIGNAVKYTVEGGVTNVIDFSYRDDNTIVLTCSVSDTGIGISRDKIGHIFEKFTQADETTTRNFGGTGLGLTITQDLLGMMGGHIKVDSVEGLGSTFSFDLPIPISAKTCVETGEVISTSGASDVSDDDMQEKIKNARILVVEDNEFNVILIRKFLKKIGIDEAVYAKDGAEGVRAVQDNQPFDLILMDCHMPVKSGYVATEEIRAYEAERNDGTNVPIVALTADAMVGVKEKCLKSGMNDYLTKPVDFNDLNSVMKKWLTKDKRQAA